jgi:hypothetical protein
MQLVNERVRDGDRAGRTALQQIARARDHDDR